MQVRRSFPLADDIVGSFAPALGPDLPAYRNHVCRVLNHFAALTSSDGMPKDVVLIAAAFHDIAIWTDGTFDYLEPSVRRARSYLVAHDLPELEDEIGAIVTQHHKIRRYQGGHAVDAFRRADLVDVSLGMVRCGLPASFIREVGSAFPDEGFHRRLVLLTARQFLRTPLRPLPMIRW